MKHFETWFSHSNLIINTEKTRAMVFHFNKTCNLGRPTIVLNNVEINYTSEVKFSGINISNNLKWNAHIQFACSKLNKAFSTIASLRGDLILFMLRNIYFEKYHSVFGYGTILWCGEMECVMVLMIQKRALHSVKGLHNRQSSRQIFKKLQILTLTALYQYISLRC